MDSTKSMQELTVAFDQALVAAGYSESRLSNFRTVTKRLLKFGADAGIECYSSDVGKQFLEKYYPVEFDGRLVHKLPFTTQYAWRTIALLNDFNTHGSFFRARRLTGNLQLTSEFQNLNDKFGDGCRSKGTSEATVYRRQADLRKFFNYLHSNKIAIFEISHKTVVGFLGTNILREPVKPCEAAHYAAFPDNIPPQLLQIYYQGMNFDTTKHREMRTYGTEPPFELSPKITYSPTG